MKQLGNKCLIYSNELMDMKKTSSLSTPTSDFWNDTILQNIDYANYVAKHKYNLGTAGVKMGLSPWKIIAHDWSKFKPKSFDVYEDYWFGPTGIKGTLSPETLKAFRNEVQKHYETEAHHNHKLGLPQDLETQMEAIADWYSVSTNTQKISFPRWWDLNKEKLLLNKKITIEAFNHIENKLKQDLNLFTYTVEKLKNVLF